MSCDKTCASANEFFRWEVDSTGGVIIAAFLDDKASSVDIPAQIDGKPVVEIGPGAFSLRRALTKISLPDGVRKLDSNAFSRLPALTEIRLPDGLQTIGNKAFYACKALTEICLPDGLETLGAGAFGDCGSLVEISLPPNLETLGKGAFLGCSSLRSIRGAEGNVAFRSIDGVLFSADGRTLVAYPSGKTATAYVVPDGVVEIAPFAFWECKSLAEVEFPSSLRTIGACAFLGTALTDVALPSGLETLGAAAFAVVRR